MGDEFSEKEDSDFLESVIRDTKKRYNIEDDNNKSSGENKDVSDKKSTVDNTKRSKDVSHETDKDVSKDVSHETDHETDKDVSHETDKVEEKTPTIDKNLLLKSKEYLQIKGDLQKANSWGHERNRVLVKGYKALCDKVKTLVESNIIYDEEANNILSCFDAKKIEESDAIENSNTNTNTFSGKLKAIDNLLSGELVQFKKYTNYDEREIDEYYDCFFNNLSIYTKEQRKEVLDYIEDSKPADALKFILSEGEIMLQKIVNPSKQHGSVFAYVVTLEKEVKELKEKLTKREARKKEKEEEEDYILPKNNGSKAITIENIMSRFDR